MYLYWQRRFTAYNFCESILIIAVMNSETVKHKIFKNLTGTWNVSREIENFGSAAGTATFVYKGENSIHYREDIKVEPFTTDSYEAFREYFYKYDKDDDKITMYFKDLQLFSELEISGEKKLSGEHLCGLDNYNVLFNFLSQDKFTTSYHVKGPKKDYKIETTYDRTS